MEALVGVRVGVLVEVTSDVGMDMEMLVGNGVAAGMQATTSRKASTAKTVSVNLCGLWFILAPFLNNPSRAGNGPTGY